MVQQRLAAVKEVLEGATVADVARRNGVARQTLHDWLRRYGSQGLSGLIAKSTRPGKCPHQMTPTVEAAINARNATACRCTYVSFARSRTRSQRLGSRS